MSDPLGALVDRARGMGADEATFITPGDIAVENQFPELCKPPQCDGYGRSANCPPYEMTPDEFRNRLKEYDRALVFRFDVPMEILLDEEERNHVNRLVQETAATVERLARDLGYARSWGLAFGSCKRIFCDEHESCNVISGGECRNPDRARPSLSGLGVNFNRLNWSLGWDANASAADGGTGDVSMGTVTGIVLVG
jgi:predicted metal-binding protein